MELRRTLLIVAIAVVTYLLILSWQKDYGPKPGSTSPDAVAETQAAAEVPASDTPSADVPDVPVIAAATTPTDAPSVTATPVAGVVRVKTDVLDLQINTRGGDIIRAALPEYTESIDSKNPFVLLNNTAAHQYVAQSGLIGPDGPDGKSAGRPLYQTTSESFKLVEGKDTLEVVLTLPAENGVSISKIFEFTRGSYLIKTRYVINNASAAPWSGLLYAQLKRDNAKDPSASNQGFGMMTFLGGAWWTAEKPYNKADFDEFSEKPLKQAATGGWAAILQHYFLSAWIAEPGTANVYTTRRSGNDNIIGYTGPITTVAPGTQQTLSASLYVGPKIQKDLEAISAGLELTVDYGWLWPVSQFLFWLLGLIHGWVNNWGWAIILLTVLVKAAFFQLSAASYKSMAKMRQVMPEMTRIKEQFGGDRAKMSQAMMDLYKKEKINPLGGCLPILVQMPVFIALYYCLMESVELRHAEWALWINDLSVMDPYFVLPLIMGATMFIQQQLNPAPPDPMQARVMKIMPIVFTFMFLWFPAGLVLYWVVNNTLSIIQQWVITRNIENAAKKA
ncbi:MAG: membrane protein insertase YidC [Hydrogenophaga sp.]|uniref:membrane protein insertase YidC n=1 Tax=Hydrogenophaga sp. TaxID=1904254 RepID=UPI00272FE95F|nr:membrane protein insertase YidC [Hydrogenophaga sp.]MDP2166615.1 membrane protein insertase YidC [Hydrogenophaga sp.]